MPVLAVNHPFYVRTVSNLERTAVRDKLLRLVQYFSRFLGYYLYRKGFPVTLVGHLKALTSSLALARKAFRAGKPLGNFRAALLELGNHTSDKVLHLTSIGKNLSQGLYLTFDTLNFLVNSKSVKFSSARTQLFNKSANRFWFLAVASGLIDALYRSYTSKAQLKALSVDEKATPEEKLKVQQNIKKQLRLALWNAIDIFIPLNNLGVVKVDDGLIGLAGTITSAFAIQDMW